MTANRSPGLRFSSAQLQHSRGPKLPSRPQPNGRQRQLLLSARTHRQLGKSITRRSTSTMSQPQLAKLSLHVPRQRVTRRTFRHSPQRGLILQSRIGLIFESASAADRPRDPLSPSQQRQHRGIAMAEQAMQRLSLAPPASSAGKRAALGLHGSAAQRRDKEQQLREPLIAGGSLELAE